jgi:hypothetical protein
VSATMLANSESYSIEGMNMFNWDTIVAQVPHQEMDKMAHPSNLQQILQSGPDTLGFLTNGHDQQVLVKKEVGPGHVKSPGHVLLPPNHRPRTTIVFPILSKRDMLEEAKTTHMGESINNTHATRVPMHAITSTGPVYPHQGGLLVPVHVHQQQVKRVHHLDLHSILGGVQLIGQQHVEGCLCQDDHQHTSHRRIRGPIQISSTNNLKANNQYICPEVGSPSPMQNVALAFLLVRDTNRGSRVMVITIKKLLARDQLKDKEGWFSCYESKCVCRVHLLHTDSVQLFSCKDD